jgi:monothiol glutaredoxin
MPRATLAESNIHPAIRDKIAKNQQAIVAEVQAAVAVWASTRCQKKLAKP